MSKEKKEHGLRKPDQPKGRLPDGTTNPEYSRWIYKKHKTEGTLPDRTEVTKRWYASEKGKAADARGKKKHKAMLDKADPGRITRRIIKSGNAEDFTEAILKDMGDDAY